MFERIKKWFGYDKEPEKVTIYAWNNTADKIASSLKYGPDKPANKDKYIYQTNEDSYTILKSINGKLTNFGTYNYSVARNVKGYCMDKKWRVEPEEVRKLFNSNPSGIPAFQRTYTSKSKPREYIYGPTPNGKYVVRKSVDGKTQNYGTYPLEKATLVRDYCNFNNWKVPSEIVRETFNKR